MNATRSGAQHPQHARFQPGGRSVGWWQLFADFAGALIVTSYLVFFDRVVPADDITLVIIKVTEPNHNVI